MDRREIRGLLTSSADKTDELAYVLAIKRRGQSREDDRFRQRGRGRSDLRHPREQPGHRQWPKLEQDRNVREAREDAELLSGMQRFQQPGQVTLIVQSFRELHTPLGYIITSTIYSDLFDLFAFERSVFSLFDIALYLVQDSTCV